MVKCWNISAKIIAMCCSVCLTLEHNSCSDKNYVPYLSAGIVNSQEYKNLVTDLGQLVEEITERQEMINNADQDNEYNNTKTLADIQVFRKQVNELHDKIEEDTRMKVSTIYQENNDEIKTASEKCQSLLSYVKSMAADMEKNAKAGNQLFVLMKQSRHRIVEIEKQLEEIDACKITRYSFLQEEKIQQMLFSLSAIWSLSLRRHGTSSQSARFLSKVNVKAENDEELCVIVGIAVTGKDRMVVVDQKNIAVKLIAIGMNRVISCLSLSSKPFDITEMNQNQIAIALPNETKIAIVNASDELSISHIIDASEIVASLYYDGSNFITACLQPDCIRIIDISDRTLKTLPTEKLFTQPRYIALNRGKDVVYITDDKRNTVTCMTLDGQVISVYRHNMLIKPFGITIDKYDAVYVCSTSTHTVHQLTPCGDHIRILLTSENGQAMPGAITYVDQDDLLYIGNATYSAEKRNFIRLYQLE